jgi:hypothetical protein
MSGDIVSCNRFHLRPIYATNVFGEVIHPAAASMPNESFASLLKCSWQQKRPAKGSTCNFAG